MDLSNRTIRLLFILTFLAAFPTVTLNAQATYSWSLPCGQADCLGLVINDEAAIAGFTVPQEQFFAAYPGKGVVSIGSGYGVASGINNSGVVVGNDSANEAVAYLPEIDALLNLDPVFGWTSGQAVSINDNGDILGNGNPPSPSSLLPDLDGVLFGHINNQGQVVGTYTTSGSTPTGFLYSPVQPLATFPGYSPIALNNAGQVILYQSVYSSTCACYAQSNYLYTPGQNLKLVLSSPYYVLGMNDAAEIIAEGTGDYFYSTPQILWTAASGSVPITSLLPADFPYTFWQVKAINNRGQILIWVYLPAPNYGSTSVILTPPNQTPANVSSAATRRDDPGVRPERTGCANLTLNSLQVCQAAEVKQRQR